MGLTTEFGWDEHESGFRKFICKNYASLDCIPS